MPMMLPVSVVNVSTATLRQFTGSMVTREVPSGISKWGYRARKAESWWSRLISRSL